MSDIKILASKDYVDDAVDSIVAVSEQISDAVAQKSQVQIITWEDDD